MPDGTVNWTAAATGIAGMTVGVIGMIIAALINRAATDGGAGRCAPRLLIEGYEREIAQLQAKIARLEGDRRRAKARAIIFAASGVVTALLQFRLCERNLLILFALNEPFRTSMP